MNALSTLMMLAETRFLLGTYAASGELDAFEPLREETLDEVYTGLVLDGWMRDLNFKL
jgi:hypothetical protein